MIYPRYVKRAHTACHDRHDWLNYWKGACMCYLCACRARSKAWKAGSYIITALTRNVKTLELDLCESHRCKVLIDRSEVIRVRNDQHWTPYMYINIYKVSRCQLIYLSHPLLDGLKPRYRSIVIKHPRSLKSIRSQCFKSLLLRRTGSTLSFFYRGNYLEKG